MGFDIYKDKAQKAEQKMKLCKEYADKYFPTGVIELLIVGESPPIGETYFYIPEDLRRRHQGLPAKIFRALFNATTSIDKSQCDQFLREFQKRNYLLSDVVPFPIDCFVPPIRAEVIDREMGRFSEKIGTLNLSVSCNKLLILPSGTYQELETKRYDNTRNRFKDFGFKSVKWSEAEIQLISIARTLKKRNAL